MRLTRHDLDFLMRLSLGDSVRRADIGDLGERLAQGRLVQNVGGSYRLTDAGAAALDRAMLARVV